MEPTYLARIQSAVVAISSRAFRKVARGVLSLRWSMHLRAECAEWVDVVVGGACRGLACENPVRADVE